MEKLVFETQTVRLIFNSEDAKVLGGIKLAYDEACKKWQRCRLLRNTY